VLAVTAGVALVVVGVVGGVDEVVVAGSVNVNGSALPTTVIAPIATSTPAPAIAAPSL
jgi:hypothetical protein